MTPGHGHRNNSFVSHSHPDNYNAENDGVDHDEEQGKEEKDEIC